MSDYDQLAYNLRKPLSTYLMSYAVLLDLGRGTAFPTVGHDGAAVQAGARFFRTDLGFACYYDGTRWLTAHEYEADITRFQQTTMPYTGAAPATLGVQPVRSTYDYYITRAQLYLFVATTNNGTNFWTVRISHRGSAAWTTDTSGDAANTNLNKGTDVNTPFTGGAGFLSIEIPTAGKTGAPGALTAAASVWYRLIIP